MSRQPFEKKTNRKEILEVIEKIVEENNDQEKILVTLNSFVNHMHIKSGKDIHPNTARRYGFTQNGYYSIKWPEVFQWNTEGRSTRGMIINVEKFKEKVSKDQVDLIE